MSPLHVALAALVLFLGAAAQGTVGFGLSLVAAPLLILIDPHFVPAPLIIASFVLNLLVIRRERGAHYWRQMRWPIAACVPGSLIGAVIVRAFASDGLTIISGLLILLGVGLTASGLQVRRTHATLSAAGALGGLMGTAVGIGGPPLALLFARSSGPDIRGSLSRYFGAGSVISLVLLGALGQLSLDDLWFGLVLVPGTVLGYFLSNRLADRVDHRHVRVAVLVLSASSAVIAIVRALVT